MSSKHGLLAFGDSITNGGGELQWGVALQSWTLWVARGLGLPYTGFAVDGARARDVVASQIPAFSERSAEAQLKIQAATASGQKIVVPDPDTCERQAAQFANNANLSRLPGQREWPALLRLCDRLDPSYRT